MTQQRTIRRSTSCAGIGLHSGSKVTLSLKPAPANFGIRFRRADLNGFEVPATVGHIGGINYATGLARDAVRIDTVEHLLAALVSLGIDNAIVELNSPEVPRSEERRVGEACSRAWRRGRAHETRRRRWPDWRRR